MTETSGVNYTDKRQLQRAEAALQGFRQHKQGEKSEFAAEFQRLTDERQAAFGVLESLGLAALLAGCDAALKAGALKLLWLENLGNGRAAACFAGEAAELDRALKAGVAAAKRVEEWAFAQILAEPAPQLKKWLLAGAFGEQDKEVREMLEPKEALPEVKRRVRLSNAATLLECTDGELKELVRRRAPQLSEQDLANMRRQDMVDWLANRGGLQ